ncbi:MAG: hypothetical protein KF887_07500 [Paracoccaceae bacterium]|nr:MAG: hypothetical protein KF887_07500 [Paracoccaceae bacterium]
MTTALPPSAPPPDRMVPDRMSDLRDLLALALQGQTAPGHGLRQLFDRIGGLA